jgi:FAD/FMN-containing dehydrogenase
VTQAFLSETSALLGSGAVKTAAHELAGFAVDWRRRYHGKPLAVILPETPNQVAAVVSLAGQHGVALVPQGGNTGLSGGATPDGSGSQVIISLARLKRIRSTDSENKTLTIESGVTLLNVQHIAQDMGLLFPLSLGAEGSATIGGNLATNAGGTGVLRYGNARDLCLGLEVVTANGEIWNGLRGLRKDNTGYDLRDLFIGSEGTLGIITAAVLKLFPRPAGVATALVRLASPRDALTFLQMSQSRCDAALTGFEYMSIESTQIVARYLRDSTRHCTSIIGDTEGARYALSDSVLIEISHPESEQAAITLLEGVIKLALERGIASDAIVAQSNTQAISLWQLRENITFASAEDGPSIKHDIALPISGIVEFISEMDLELRAAYPGVRLINFGHFGDGNLHYNIAPPLALSHGLDRQARQQASQRYVQQFEDEIRRRVHDRVIAMGGSISAEHGLGQLRRDEAKRYKQPLEMDLMRRIKMALDPQGIFNPGKVF